MTPSVSSMLRGLFENFYADCPAEVIVDTSRAWCARLHVLSQLFPVPRSSPVSAMCCGSSTASSKRVQQNAFSPSSIFNSSHGGTVYTRANGIARADGMLGYAYHALKEACDGAHADKLLLVQCETFATDPAKVLAAIYDSLGEPQFKHDFTQVDYDARAFDAKAGTPGLHDVRPAVAAIERPTLLPPDLSQRFANDAFWRDPARHPAAVRLV
jgi:sulfotransferase